MEEAVKYLGSADPFKILRQWMELAQSSDSIKEPAAVVLSTTTVSGEPDSRVVLVKEQAPAGLIFYTNTKSQKGRQLARSPHCSLLFYWDSLSRQVRLKGKAQLASREKTIKYWSSRPRESQLSQWVSRQSAPVSGRTALEAEAADAAEKWSGRSIPCPENWSGYCVNVYSFEFWRERDHRLHDRFVFHKKKEGLWNIQRLYP